ncbi:unnamed protein product [Rotaria magnacalcarata]|uniref:F-box domain-containing protein n=2 Tax=Rotaria magnacalcarata TaxID=392030 RepID=A0A816YPK2_9BILA|nr:unnamed protein product [Rotaria magnacalcarata]CAF1644452.1 unnamed protein product [Rotaria magnacalcarata]CAF2161211.1 unnamed protein product [Rotaria magnacalcarata]CAF2164825.1 unnamed protein product [Rotaria magnacalcarata]CAF3942759.1 unnamed protein product [Rotaria magnacalcarata]
MTNATFESLPNEVLLIIFGYLSTFDLCEAFLNVKNVRIENLITSIRHTLDVSLMHYDKLRQFLSKINEYTNRSVALIDSVVLHDSSACTMLCNHLETRLNDSEDSNDWFRSIKKLHILNSNSYGYGLVQPILKPLVYGTHTLKYLHLVFDRPAYSYPTILSELVLHRISVYSMILEVEQGHEYYPNELTKDFHKMQPLYWPNTVKLTLSIQHPSELMLLLKRDALPALEHLNVTNEDIHTVLPLSQYKPVSNIQFCEHDLRQTADGTRLRSLILRFITLRDATLLLGSLSMPLLEKLIIVDLYVHTLNHIDEFQKLCGPTHVPALKNLYFSFCFPQDMEHVWRKSSFHRNGEWPFDNIDCYIDESLIATGRLHDFATTTLFIVYKRPISVLLQHRRTLHNHRFATHASAPIFTTRRQSLLLTYDKIDKPDELFKTLQVLARCSVDKLHLKYRGDQANVSMASNCALSGNLFLRHLRSMTFDFELMSIKRSATVAIVKQILDVSPNLSDLVIDWSDFCHCSQTYSNLKHLHLILDRIYPEPKQHFDVRRLAQLAPHLCSLETSGANIMLDENLVKFVLKIIRQFDQLVYLTLNKNSLYKSKENKKVIFKETLIAAGHNRVFDCNNIRIQFYTRDALYIWL